MTSERAFVKTQCWEEIRAFIAKRPFLRSHEIVDDETYDAILDRRTGGLSGTLMRELSVFIDGYKVAKS